MWVPSFHNDDSQAVRPGRILNRLDAIFYTDSPLYCPHFGPKRRMALVSLSYF